MARRRSTAAVVDDRRRLLEERLKVIKQRYHDLIVRPRNQLMSGLITEEDEVEEFEERAELQVLEGYGLHE
jgi:hypothetical protein